MPAFLPYIVILVAGLGIFFVMSRMVNPPLRDDAIYDAVTKNPGMVEPRFLRAYLADERNKRHRDDAQKQLARFYDPAISHVQEKASNDLLKEGMIKVLESVRTADQPIVSMRVTEMPAGKAGAGERQKNLREAVVGGNAQAGASGGILDEFAKAPGLGPIQPPPGIVFTEQPPPIGHQLLAFVEAPEDAQNAHFDITYTLKPGTRAGRYLVEVTVVIRTDVEGQPVASSGLLLPREVTLEQLDAPNGMDPIRDMIVDAIVGKVGQPG